jgi:hypothetical protein
LVYVFGCVLAAPGGLLKRRHIYRKPKSRGSLSARLVLPGNWPEVILVWPIIQIPSTLSSLFSDLDLTLPGCQAQPESAFGPVTGQTPDRAEDDYETQKNSVLSCGPFCF